MFAYLQKRGIAPQVIRGFIEAGLLYEDSLHHNCVFVGREVSGKPVFASKRGTMGFCAEKGKGMGWSLKGHTWGNPQPISDPTVKTMMAYFYAHSTGVFTDQAKALGVDDVWNSDYTWTMNGGSGQPRPPRQRADRPGAGPGGVTDNCLPIHLDIVKKVRYDVGYQTTGGVAK